MSLNSEMLGLANSIRSKSLIDDKMSIDDMIMVVNSKLEPLIDDTANVLYPVGNLRNENGNHWVNSYINQVGQDNEKSPIYTWRTPSQSNDFLLQLIDGVKLGDTFISRFYARADSPGDKVHFEMFGGAGEKDYVLSNYWTPCYSIAKITGLNADNKSAVYYGSVETNSNNISICLPTLVRLGGGAVIAFLRSLSDLMCYYLLLNRKEV